MKIVELDAAAYRDIPRQLRELAGDIEDGHHPDLQFIVAVLVHPGARVEVRAWGDCTAIEAIGALARGMLLSGR